MQNSLPELPQLPPRPTCTPILANGGCAQAWQQYNVAVRQYNAALAARNAQAIRQYGENQAQAARSAEQQQAQQDLSRVIADNSLQLSTQQAQANAKLAELTAEKNSQIALRDSQIQSLTAALTREPQHVAAARKLGLEQGIGIGVAASLVLAVLAVGIRRLLHRSPRPGTARAASAL